MLGFFSKHYMPDTCSLSQLKVVVLEATFLWWISRRKKIKIKIYDINWFLLEILFIRESCNLTGWEAQLATCNIWHNTILSFSQIPPTFDRIFWQYRPNKILLMREGYKTESFMFRRLKKQHYILFLWETLL